MLLLFGTEFLSLSYEVRPTMNGLTGKVISIALSTESAFSWWPNW